MPKFSLTTLSFIVLFHFSTVAQDTVWYSYLHGVTSRDNADFSRIKLKTDSGYLVKVDYMLGAIQVTGLYADDSLRIPKGTFHYYNNLGILTQTITYVDGKMNGFEAHYYMDGQEQLKGYNKDSLREGPWFGYYPSGKLAAKAVYVAGKKTELVFYNEDGLVRTTDAVFEREAEYPGGPYSLLKFLNKNLRYPNYAFEAGIEGVVVVQFTVLKTGKVTDLKVVRGVEKHLDAEAIRVLRQMVDWQPAMIAGLPTDSYKTQPVVFSLKRR